MLTAILDWGIGGMGVLGALRARALTCDVLYFSDSGFTPYGKLSVNELRDRFHHIAIFLASKGCKHVLVACNAASSVLLSDDEEFSSIAFHSIIPAAVKLAENSRHDRIGIIGGNRTIESGIYQKAFLGSEKKYFFQTAQALSALVEDGQLEDVDVEKEIKKVLRSLPSVDSILLACTHYPALAPVFKKFSPSVVLLDPSATMIEDLDLPAGKNRQVFYTTGNVDQSLQSAKIAFGVEINSGTSVSL